MIRDVVTPSMKPDGWAGIRTEIFERIQATMGETPELSFDGTVQWGGEYDKDGLTVRELSYTCIPGIETPGMLILPEGFEAGQPRAAVLTIHGTNFELAHASLFRPEDRPNRAYAYELAKNGFIVMSVDQLAFAIGGNEEMHEEAKLAFYNEFPNWSLDGARLWIQQCALDILQGLDGVDAQRLGCMGNSLGGRTALYLAAFDPRIKAAVPSTGISPNITNLYRHRPGPTSFSPPLDADAHKDGKPPFEYQELLALVAPRAALYLEPWNDPYNPFIDTVFRCFEKARFVYQLLNADAKFQLLCHGDGHDTTGGVRDYAYWWLSKQLSQGS